MKLDETTILVVEDEPILQQVCALWLKRGGYQKVFTASNGLEALLICEEHKVNVLITDIHMPKMDGVVLIRTIRERGLFISGITVMSAYTDVNLVELSKLGVKKFLEKPFTSEILLDAVATSLSEEAPQR
ncbi:MAG: response regulator [Chthonomonadales bacterium]